MKKILVFGASGLVGSRFVELSSKELVTPSSAEVDITDREQVTEFLDNHRPSVVVNFAAYTDVGEAENQRIDKSAECWRVNVEGARNIVDAIKGTDTHFVQISTDMVFPGSEENPGPYPENAKPEIDSKKVTWYGYTKGEMERLITAEIPNQATIVRIMYPVRASFEGKSDYLRWPLNLFDKGKLYPMFTDQQVTITYIDELCEALEKIIGDRKQGIFHVSSNRTTTPYKIVSYLINKARGTSDAVKRGSLREFLETNNNPVRYPQKSGLSVKETEKVLNMTFSTPRQIVDKLVAQGMGR